MLCPVCKTECGEKAVCLECGFDEVGKRFINHDEAELWRRKTLIPYKAVYCNSGTFNNWSLIGDYIDYYRYSFEEDRLTIREGADSE